MVKNLKMKEPSLISNLSKELEDDTIAGELEYFGWRCPYPQWITLELAKSKTFSNKLLLRNQAIKKLSTRKPKR